MPSIVPQVAKEQSQVIEQNNAPDPKNIMFFGLGFFGGMLFMGILIIILKHV